MSKGTLTFFCGKMGAGKSTKAQAFAAQAKAVLLSEDEWLAALYPNQITSVPDYVEYSNRLKPKIKSLVQSILSTGANVVMDFPANTLGQRDWFRSIFTEIEAPHQMIYIEATDAICLERIAKRREQQPERRATDTPEMFAQMSQYFVVPTADEAFNIVTSS